jgi:autophagy-related protein 9
MSSSRPFLNMINPMTSRTYQGYMRADQSPVEEENELEDRDVESGGPSRTTSSSKAEGKEKAALWSSETSLFKPNIKTRDLERRDDSSDDEVPQSFIIETPTARSNAVFNKNNSSSKSKGKAKASVTEFSPPRGPQRGQPLHSVSGRRMPPTGPILPISAQDNDMTLSVPPRPSELDEGGHKTKLHALSSRASSSSGTGAGKQRAGATMGGLDAYERALWNWVNVYNLDAFLQEVYYYYEGKGIYSIALARGLNLLYVHLFFKKKFCFEILKVGRRTMGFVIGFSTFLMGCVDYPRLRDGNATHLSQVIVDRCVSKYVFSFCL